ncbi:hypothetical protein BDQ17DRAFT_1419538 [Cyathus striatus]|nr:hypothetical protein BDQ17DRAFT_1419538 [Cyathus striatus]
MSNYPSPRTDNDDESLILSVTPTPQGPLSNNPRSFSQGSHQPQWSPIDTPHHHHQGTSYFPAPVSPGRQGPTPILIRNSSAHSTQRIGPRSNSISSSHARRESDNEQRGSSHTGTTSRRRGKAAQRDAAIPDDDDSGEGDDSSGNANQNDDDPITLKERQSMINVHHPFGLPIWKPALAAFTSWKYILGLVVWLVAGVCMLSRVGMLYIIPFGGNRYATLVFGLGWYLAWPFGKYVEGDLAALEQEEEDEEDEDEDPTDDEESSSSRRWSGGSEGTETIRGVPIPESPVVTRETSAASRTPAMQHGATVSWQSDVMPGETTALLTRHREMRIPLPVKSYGATPLPASPPLSTASSSFTAIKESIANDFIGKVCFWLFLVTIIAPLMLLVCMVCWGLVVTVPMAKLNWALIKHLFEHPTSIRFCAAPPVVVVTAAGDEERTPGAVEEGTPVPARFSVKHPRLSEGQLAPSGSPTSTVLLCVYRAVGWQYYKYTVGGVNILFVNLLPIVFFVIFDGFILMPMAEKLEHSGKHVPAFLAALTSHV